MALLTTWVNSHLGFTLNTVGTFMPAAFIIKEAIPEKPIAETWVTVVTGAGGDLRDAGGAFPDVAIWDDNGNRIGRYRTKLGDKIGQSSERTVRVPNNENNGEISDPQYVMLSHDTDATCIAMIQVSNGRLSGTVYGDTGYKCGQAWYHSQRKFKGDSLMTECVWLDSDHSHPNFNARAMSFHLRDMLPSPDKLKLYNSELSYLCKSTPRYSFWRHLIPDGVVPFFYPVLKYNKDSVNPKLEGTNENPIEALDRFKYNKDVYIQQGESEKEYRRRRRTRSTRSSKRQGSNMDPDYLVLTEIPGQTAREICEHPNSVGYDIVSFVDGRYCDLTKRKLYDLCAGSITTNCFDVNSTTVIGAQSLTGRSRDSTKGRIAKLYKTRACWK
ncbi:hypothetical protein COL5a_005899 [Colletotrichum fioriniae]|uniref:uncharacterized protein n=1 Tax=Colletotrichum fioriniae TaxID=710243 RepID=UPI00230191C8|nr:uncharacterized protein COL516b_006709 [Colletotrichum fioriniae]KAJ0303197.1 hypothetical protein COL516b_006709 [Colletotrichum fioriniae]KAJ0327519.1 hypothetical protein COL5a_005899 [Colletotrichum fioriniae]KAJ3938372.1 hypothetical protein N0V96_011618 [Colletotrichum fioriniae]